MNVCTYIQATEGNMIRLTAVFLIRWNIERKFFQSLYCYNSHMRNKVFLGQKRTYWIKLMYISCFPKLCHCTVDRSHYLHQLKETESYIICSKFLFSLPNRENILNNNNFLEVRFLPAVERDTALVKHQHQHWKWK